MCDDMGCDCRKAHNEKICSSVNPEILVKKLFNMKLDCSKIQNYIDLLFMRIIDWISEYQIKIESIKLEYNDVDT